MDDYSITSLNESKNEWCARLVNILTPCVLDGLKSIFNEAIVLCNDNNEEEKYLMTFQTFLGRIPNWNKNMIIDEKKRIQEISNCGYLEELITCVHIIQLKALSCVRVGTKQKKIDIDIPPIDDFIHKIYIFTARKVYTNIYLFEKHITPLSIQKNNRELENIIKECILETIRDSIPVEILLRAYMDETEEENVEIKEEIIRTPDDDEDDKDKAVPPPTPDSMPPPPTTDMNRKIVGDINIDTDTGNDVYETNVIPSINEQLTFSDVDNSVDTMGNEENLDAPKNIEYLEDLASKRSYDDEDDEEDEELITIGDTITLDVTDINDLNDKDSLKLNELVLNDIEVL
jgi:hypothetical protein|tara:strand:- start:294 stop:1328 length:1035 start_codon:yes stop_codon:yes gene_type:complete